MDRATLLSPAYRQFLATRYFSGLDALRAISVIGVIWVHVAGHQALTLLNQGHRGVDLFFAISGFLVTTLLLRENRQAGRISLRNFYMRRTLRIFPLYYAVLALYCLLVFLTLRGTPKAAEFWSNLAAFATYTANWFVSSANAVDHGVTFYFAWSLATEEQFYLFWPALLVLLLWKAKRPWLSGVTAVVVLLSMQWVAVSHGTGLIATIVGSLAPAILFGVMFALLLDDPKIFDSLYPSLGHRLAAPSAFLFLMALLQLDGHGTLIQFAMALLVATVCLREDTVLHPFLTWRPAVQIGVISYGIYLMHMIAANVVRRLLGHQSGVDVFLLTCGLVYVMAWLSFRYFETPVLRLKGRFAFAVGRPPEMDPRPTP